jgi:hypothetical protein
MPKSLAPVYDERPGRCVPLCVKPHNARGNIPALYIFIYHEQARNPLFMGLIPCEAFSHCEGEGGAIIV